MKRVKSRKIAGRRSGKDDLRPSTTSAGPAEQDAARYAKGSIVVTLDPDVARCLLEPGRRMTLSEFSRG